MVLDRSGSMASCCDNTIEAVNKYLLEGRQDANMKTADFELVIFDSESIDTIRNATLEAVSDISREDYVPRGGTPLYDAIGRGIDNLDAKIAASNANGGGKAILVIVTDGEENSSRKYNHAAISELIKARQAAGWLVVFLGAGLNAAQQGIHLGVHAGKTANIGTDRAALRSSSQAMYAMSAGYAATMDFKEAQAYSAGAEFSADDRRAMGDASAGVGLTGVLTNGKKPTKPAPARPIVHMTTGRVTGDEDSWNSSDDAWKTGT
jgi:uncharacterized protein YegL